jgi:Gelsolin repeat
MYHFSSGKCISFKVVPLNTGSLAQSGVFVLDDGLTIYLWAGSKTTTRQRFDCENVVRMLVTSERHSNACVIHLDERETDPQNPAELAEELAFFACLGADRPLRSAQLARDHLDEVDSSLRGMLSS